MQERHLPLVGALILAALVVVAYLISPNRPAPVARLPLFPTATTTQDAATTATLAASTTASTTAPDTTAIAPTQAPLEADPNTQLASVGAAATSTPAVPVEPTPTLTQVGGTLLKSTVNILCLSKRSSGIKSISGSGVIIDPRGLILTAAHVAQYLLLADAEPNNISCTIRTGSPAVPAYTAEPVYVSPSWIKENAGNLSETAPKGTGENDFAVLAITGSATGAPLPSSFTYVPLSNSTPVVGEKLAISGYAAQYLAGSEVEHDLSPTIVFDSITDRYTFDGTSVDVIAVAGTAAAQEGSSGGGMADADAGLVGVITTSSIKGDISQHVLNAITPLHIRASFAADSGTGTSLDTYLAGASLSTLVNDFKSEGQSLAKILINANS